MQTFKYIRYFLYLAYNWNIKIAWHIIRQEIKGEKKYAINTTGADELASLEKKDIDISHATIYMPAGYDLLEEIFNWLKALQLKHFVDIGCGKGRAMAVAANYGFDKVTGIDFSKEFCNAANENLDLVKRKLPLINYNIINNDAFYYRLPSDADCIFMFNPFDEMIMSGVIRNIDKHRKTISKEIYIIYLNPLHKNLFTAKGYKEIFSVKKMKYLEGCILKK